MDALFSFSSDVVGIFESLSSGLFGGIYSVIDALADLSS